MSNTRPFGTWPSPITAQVAASQGLRLAAPAVDGTGIYWLEARPSEGGRNVVVRCTEGGAPQEMTPAGFNVRSRVHEYGGGSYVVRDGTVFFSNFADQRLYRVDGAGPEVAPSPVAITPEGRWHFADAVVDAARGRLICVREDHSVEGRECVNTHRQRRDRRQQRRGRSARRRIRLLRHAAPQSGRRAAGVDLLAASQHAVGRHRAVAGRRGRRRLARQPATRRRQRHRVDLSARLVARWRAALRERPRRSLASVFRW